MSDKTKLTSGNEKDNARKADSRSQYQKPVIKTYKEEELAEKQLTVYAGSLNGP